MKVPISKTLIHSRLFFLATVILVCGLMLFFKPIYMAQLAWFLQIPVQSVEFWLCVTGIIALVLSVPNLLYYLEGDNCEERYQKECERNE